MERIRAATVLLVGAALVLAACSDGDDDPVAATTTTASDEQRTTTTSEGSTTTSSDEACDAPSSPPPRGELTHLGADFDGDDEGDTAFTLLAEDGWHLRIDLGGGRGSVDEMLATVPTDEASVETATDLDRDGDDEVWVVVGNGASTRVMGLYELDGCDLEAVQLGGGPAEFAVGGPVLLLQGIRCEDDGRITHLGASSEDGESYLTLDLTYELQAGELVRVDDTSRPLTRTDPELAAYSTFDCGST